MTKERVITAVERYEKRQKAWSEVRSKLTVIRGTLRCVFSYNEDLNHEYLLGPRSAEITIEGLLQLMLEELDRLSTLHYDYEPTEPPKLVKQTMNPGKNGEGDVTPIN